MWEFGISVWSLLATDICESGASHAAVGLHIFDVFKYDAEVFDKHFMIFHILERIWLHFCCTQIEGALWDNGRFENKLINLRDYKSVKNIRT